MSTRTSVRSSSTSEDRENGGPRSLMRVLKTFALLSRAPVGMTMADLIAALDSPKSSLASLIRPLVAEGYLVNERGRYRIGPGLLRMAAGVQSAWNFAKSVRPFMEELSSRTEETVLLGVLNKEAGALTYIETIDSPHPVRLHVNAGSTRPLYISSAGRVLLAHADPKWVEEYLAGLVIKTKSPKPFNKTWLRMQLEVIRERGYEYSIDRYTVGLASVGAALLDVNGECIASLSIAGASSRFRTNLNEFIGTVTDVAARASGTVGFAKVDQAG